jgi:hypothetical protein
MADVEDLEQAVADATAALTSEAGADSVGAGRVAHAGAVAVADYRRFDAHSVSKRPPEGSTTDPHREARHAVRAAAQTVLAQLELITLAWTAWDPPTRDEMVHELEAAGRELGERVRQLVGAPG